MNRTVKILFLSADPDDVGYRPHLLTEIRGIEKEIDLASNQNLFKLELELEPAVRTRDLQRVLMSRKPDIVHFSGHGSTEGIFLEDDAGKKKVVSKEHLAELFYLLLEKPRVVFLNACYTDPQLLAFKDTIDFTIGMKDPVDDAVAIEFAAAFYRALAYSYPVELAFKLAVNHLGIERLTERGTPVFYTKSGVDGSRPLFDQNSHTPAPVRSGQEPTPQPDPAQEDSACIWIHGWAKRIYDRLPAVELDWTKYFDRDSRAVPDQETWERHLYPELREAKKELDRHRRAPFIDVRGKLPLTATLAVGAVFPEVGGYTIRAEQPTHGRTVLWRSDSGASDRRFKITSKKRNVEARGNDVLIALSITGVALKEVSDLFDQRSEDLAAMIYAEPNNGPGDGALHSDSDAVALAIHAKEIIRDCQREYNPSQIHLVVYGPAAYCLFLGQRLNALGKILTYERNQDRGYKPSLSIQTG
jgi:hypothetical protein